MNLKKLLLFFLIFPLSIICLQAQDGCGCEDLEITFCYLPSEIYCNTTPGNGACGYTIDGKYMVNALKQKLESSINFGVKGVVNCPLFLVPLTENINIEYIEEQKCDIIFTGNFALDTLTNQVNIEVSSIPEYSLQQMKEWSEKCETNLVITSQAEADIWGYTIENLNVNPNFSVGNQLGDFIFNGPFGVVDLFFQGGSYQGIIVEGPSTGFTVLGIDSNESPTLVIDNKTNDIILGDIGIFCGGLVGDVTDGQGVGSLNDRLALNIFALACQIAGLAPTTIDVAICPGDIYLRPNGGEVTQEGTYIDTLISSNNCDSLVISKVVFSGLIETSVTYDGCSGDGYFIRVGGEIFDEGKPTGEKLILSENGCDSLISISLMFKENEEVFYENEICSNDEAGITIGDAVFNPDNPSGTTVLTASNGCDSIVNVFLNILPVNSRIESYKICDGEEIEIDGVTYFESGVERFVFTSANGCDSIIELSINYYPDLPSLPIPNPLEININEDYNFDLNIGEAFNIDWDPIELLSCTDCDDFYIIPNFEYDKLEYTVSDTFGCSRTDTIMIEYECPVYIPNVFSLSSKNVENQTFYFRSPCKRFMTTYEMTIFDRWGSMVFHSDNPELVWRGMDNGEEPSIGVYFYVMKYTSHGREKVIAGDVSLLR